MFVSEGKFSVFVLPLLWGYLNTVPFLGVVAYTMITQLSRKENNREDCLLCTAALNRQDWDYELNHRAFCENMWDKEKLCNQHMLVSVGLLEPCASLVLKLGRTQHLVMGFDLLSCDHSVIVNQIRGVSDIHKDALHTWDKDITHKTSKRIVIVRARAEEKFNNQELVYVNVWGITETLALHTALLLSWLMCFLLDMKSGPDH